MKKTLDTVYYDIMDETHEGYVPSLKALLQVLSWPYCLTDLGSLGHGLGRELDKYIGTKSERTNFRTPNHRALPKSVVSILSRQLNDISVIWYTNIIAFSIQTVIAFMIREEVNRRRQNVKPDKK